ncbi:MAG: zinc ribbon domain-containing protein [Aquificaceae bacterium]|nr:transposase [Aquificaceae bacterium]MDW8433590.1 zinc ribbon domain-containing protein [Aquificaceae bacterium]
MRQSKLKELQEEYGIEVVCVNPAYTSQACIECGYVDNENRKSALGLIFKHFIT